MPLRAHIALGLGEGNLRAWYIDRIFSGAPYHSGYDVTCLTCLVLVMASAGVTSSRTGLIHSFLACFGLELKNSVSYPFRLAG